MGSEHELAALWRSRQAEVAVTEEWRNFSPEELDRRYYRPLVALAAQAADPKEEIAAALFLEEAHCFIDRFLPSETRLERALELLRTWQEEAKRLGSPAAEGIARVLPWVTPGEKLVHIAAAGDCLMTDIRTFLRPLAAREGIGVSMDCLYLSAAADGTFPPDEFVRFAQQQKADLLAVSPFTYDGLPIYRLLRAGEWALLPQALDEVRRFVSELRALDERPLLLHGVSGLPLPRWRAHLPWDSWALPRDWRHLCDVLNGGLRALAAEWPHIWFVDEWAVAAQMGWRQANAPVVAGRQFADALFHRRCFGFGVAQAYGKVVRAFTRLRGIKVIAVDFDNTLWEGVMAEGPVRHYRERQQLLKRLQEGGIVLVALSKNDPQTIRWEEMVLQPDDFAVHAIGWELKPTTLAEIAQQLNLGLDAFHFIDDNPTERGLVASHLPQVRVWDACDPETWEMLAILPALPWWSQTEEARQRTAMYRAQLKRQEAVRAYGEAGGDRAVLEALGLTLTVHPMQERERSRVHELVNRTNQFNTTTIRYRPEELADPSRQVWVGSLRDRYGEYGLVLVAVLRGLSTGEVEIEDFVMSCRAMGYGAETTFLAALWERLGKPAMVGRFIPTERNAPAATFFARCGFVEEQPGEWRLPTGKAPEAPAPWITLAK